MNPIPTAFIGEVVTRAMPRWSLPMRRSSVQLYELREAFGFISKEHGPIFAPVGFITDFGSVLRAIKAFIDNDDPDLLYASVPHDLLYQRKGDLGDGRILTRYQSDCVLAEAMEACGAPSLKIHITFDGVRMGGHSHWGKLPYP